MFEICYSLWYGAAALSGKAGSGRLWLRIKQIIPNTGFPGRNICSAFSKRFLQQVLLQGCSTGHGLECWRFQQYGRFYTVATKRTEFKKERKDFPCNLGILS